ncbi:MAG TPA: TrmH family RNA methyltransferase [Candidatus Limnocylindrales bacterium]|nr:TrmH family RNA methyltransferase [Candidatus Limnocylindrales bacterium]
MRSLVLIAHNLRSTHNVGSLLRTAEGLGVEHVYLTGYTPYPLQASETRLPHHAQKIDAAIHKTALGAEQSQAWTYVADITPVLERLSTEGYTLAGLEQTAQSIPLPSYHPPDRIAIVLGREVEGIEPELLQQLSVHLEIPMFGRKESYNVVQAAAMALYHCRFSPM